MLNKVAQARTPLVVVEVFHKANTYVDESIRHDRETGQWLCSVTAYVGTFDSWIQSELEWQSVLDAFSVSEFHMTDFMAREQEFKNDWTDEKRNRFMERFCTIASQRPIAGVGCGIAQKDWETGLEPALREEWKHPYYFCIYGLLSLIRTWALRDAKLDLPLPLFFLFDNKPKFEGAALQLYREYQQEHDPKETIYDGIAFGSRKKYKALQMADLLVGVINRRFEEMTHKVMPDFSKMNKPLSLLVKRPIMVSFPTATSFNEFSEFTKRHPLKA
jgi:hypothetical protein